MSKTRFPPAPKAARLTNSPRTGQFGDAPAIMAKIEDIINDTLKANFLPIMSADKPHHKAPTSMPTYAAIVKPLG